MSFLRGLMVALVLALAACITTDENGVIQTQSGPDYHEAARLNTQLGIDYMRRGQDEQALDKFNRALEQNPDLALAHSSVAFIYSRRGDPVAAEKHYRRALSLAGDDPSLRNNFGVFLCGQKRLEEGERYLLQAAQDKRYRSPEAAWTNAGVCARKLPDLVKAERYFREALKLNNAFPDALAQMAWLSLQQKDYLRTRAFLQRYEQSGRATPETLYIGAVTESALGDQAAAQSYAQRLKKQFPESEESGRLPPVPSSS